MHVPDQRSSGARRPLLVLAALGLTLSMACTSTGGSPPDTASGGRTTASTSPRGAVGTDTPSSLAGALGWVPVPPWGRTAVQYSDLVAARAAWPGLPWVAAGSDADFVDATTLDTQTAIRQTTALPGDPLFPLGEDIRPAEVSLGTKGVPEIGSIPAPSAPGASEGGTSTPGRPEPARPSYRLNDASRAAYGLIPSDVDAELVVFDSESATETRRVRLLFGQFDAGAIQAALAAPDLQIDAKDEGGQRTLTFRCTGPTSETRKDGTRCREHINASSLVISPTTLALVYGSASTKLWDQMLGAPADPAKSIARQPAVAEVATALDRHHTYFTALRWGPARAEPAAPPGGTRARTDFRSVALDRDGVANAVGTTRLADHERATVLVAVSGPERAGDTTIVQAELGTGTVTRTQERWADVLAAGAVDVGATVTVLEYDPRETRFEIWWQRVLAGDFPVTLLGP